MKKTIKKKVASKKPTVKEKVRRVLNDFGVCLDCNGGREDCLHNNLIEDGGKISCATCGKNNF